MNLVVWDLVSAFSEPPPVIRWVPFSRRTLHNNLLTGTLPLELGTLTNLNFMYVSSKLENASSVVLQRHARV